MTKYIKINNGDLYAYNKKGYTVVYNGDKWNVSSLNYVSILYSDRNDYEELEENNVINEYGEEVVNGAKECFDKIEHLLYGNRR